jgi:hypothetical protein
MNREQTVWAVVSVWRGMASSVELFADESAAWNRARAISKISSQEDDVAVFAVAVPQEIGTSCA